MWRFNGETRDPIVSDTPCDFMDSVERRMTGAEVALSISIGVPMLHVSMGRYATPYLGYFEIPTERDQ
jgi:hypothetical protein